MAQRTVVVASAVGLHARPAKLFTEAAGAVGMPVLIAKDGGTPVNASSILRVMALAVKHGEAVTLTAEGDGADAVLDRLVELLATDLDAEPS
jgi:phosphocarrier protein HPr